MLVYVKCYCTIILLLNFTGKKFTKTNKRGFGGWGMGVRGGEE